MAHFCGFIKFIFLLLMLTRILPTGDSRPLNSKSSSTSSSDLIAGNEFLKLFMGQDELEREYRARNVADVGDYKESEEFDKKSAETGRQREASSRSLKIQGPKINHAEGQVENSKAANSGNSRISFLEDYDENDAILDAEARDIDLKKETTTTTKAKKDDYKILSISVYSSTSAHVGLPAVSTSSSSQRGSMTGKNRLTTTTSKYDNKSYTTTQQSVVTMTPRPPTATTYRPATTTSTTTTTQKPKTTTAKIPQNSAAASSTTGDNFINRSHKSEFSVEEVQPSTARHHQQLLQQQQQQHRPRKVVRKTFTRHHHPQQQQQHHHHTSYPLMTNDEPADSMEALDSENSASTNVVQNVLASPSQGSGTPLRSTSTVTTMFHSGQHNVSINHAMSKSPLPPSAAAHQTNVDDVDISKDLNDQQHSATGVDDQLLPFQTVIYHDTKNGGGGSSHGPQSRSISYSSISQNVEDLKKWHQSDILAEARRNVSESLKPLPPLHQSEPAKFYSQPSKMYSEPSKFYSEPSKVYSEPAKVYGEPEKFYSEPAKVYGQPSKFYSEPSKVYSEPAKMYGEPAKTYWPITVTTTPKPAPLSTIPPIAATNLPQLIATTTTPSPLGLGYPASRKPAAIVSRIAFGEAQTNTASTSTTSTTTTTSTTPATTHIPITSTIKSSFGGSFHQRTFGHRQPPTGISETTTPPRRILFNLDRLPYDLLNAPQPAATPQPAPTHLELPQQPALTYQQQQQQHLQRQQQQQSHQQQQQPQRHHNINPCLESAVTSLFSSATLSAHPALIKQRQQHSSLSDQQHSNQNAKGLPNEDLVRCVAEISNPAIPSTGTADDTPGLSYTTERSNIEELFTPTPEQNYEIEESASVMTNGRAHGVQGGSGGGGGAGRNSLTLPTPQPGAHTFQTNKQRIHIGTNINAGVVGGVGTDSGNSGVGYQHSSFTGQTNANGDAALSHAHRNLHGDGNPSPDYNAYDDGGGGEGGGDTDDYTDTDDTGHHRAPGSANDGDGKVAYVVEGRNYRKYRVETKTDDGYIVGEYGVVHHDDGNLRGVRYTADINNTNRSLIQKALLTFLKL
ncbi:formin-J [Musca vetustissima]|uniref:formin-J n=1 Tax=Musca vetustissima TaxID=27455 RepID=UPI002AB7607B|nr:formin-J [Musca vetustissima]